MSSSAACGVVSISIDADNVSRSAASRDVLPVMVELLDRFHGHRMAATWVFSDPAGTSLAARRIAREMPQQEVALLGANSPNGADYSRAEVVHTIVRRLQLAAAAGIPVTSLAVNGAWDSRNTDLLTKQGVTIVRTHGLAVDAARGTARQGISKLDGIGAQAVCHGLWHVPVSVTLRGGGWFANRIQFMRLVRSLNRAAAGGAMCHVRIDAAALVATDVPRALRTVERFLRHLERMSQQRRIVIETLRGTAQRLLPKRGVAAQSILRAA